MGSTRTGQPNVTYRARAKPCAWPNPNEWYGFAMLYVSDKAYGFDYKDYETVDRSTEQFGSVPYHHEAKFGAIRAVCLAAEHDRPIACVSLNRDRNGVPVVKPIRTCDPVLKVPLGFNRQPGGPRPRCGTCL